MVQQTLGWFGAYLDLAETVDTAAMSIIAAKQLIMPNIPIARGWITRLMTSANKICDRDHFEFCLHFEFYFYPFFVCLQAKHDLFCAEGTLWYRFLDNKYTLQSFYVIIWKNKNKKKKQQKNFNTIMRSFDLFVNCCFCGRFKYTFFLIFVTCTLAKKENKKQKKKKNKKKKHPPPPQKKTKKNTQKDQKETKFKGVWSGSTLFSEYLCGSWD